MKHLYLLAFCLLTGGIINAQKNLSFEDKDNLLDLKKQQLSGIVILDKASLLKLNPGAKYLNKSKYGNIYALPLDNMPCLVTTTQTNMPVAKIFPKTFIPNGREKIE